MRALVYQVPVVEHQNVIRPADLAEAMSNENGGALATGWDSPPPGTDR